MSNTEHYQAELPAIQAIPVASLKRPVMPVRQYVYEAECLYQWSQVDRPLLAKAGLDLALLDAIPQRAGALSEIESYWGVERFAHEDARRAWEEQSPAACELRDYGQYVFWNNPACRDGYFREYVRSVNARAWKPNCCV